MIDQRYSRQEIFEPIGKTGQQKIGKKHALLIGLGALGSSTADMLARAGVGKLTIIDRDYVDWSNLGRQLLYQEKDAAQHLPKAIAAKNTLLKINSTIEIDAHVLDVNGEQLDLLLQKGDVDLILDGTDQFEIRLLINDAAQKHQVPWIYGACVGSYGMSFTFIPGETPCLNCLLQSVPLQGPTCDTAGVISPIVHVVTAHQVTEALKLLVGDVESLRRELVTMDLWNYKHQAIRVDNAKRGDCSSCGTNPTYPYLNESSLQMDVLCGRDTVQIRPNEKNIRGLEELEFHLKKKKGKTIRNEYLLVHQGEHRMVFFKDGRVLVHGTKDVGKAKSLYKGLLSVSV